MSAIIDGIARKYNGKRSTRGNMAGRCPAHDDKSASFTFKEADGRLFLKCWAGCTFEQILEVLITEGIVPKLTQAEESKDNIRLDFGHKDVGSFSAEFDSMNYSLVAIYKYHDEEGKLLGFKARFKPKTFRFFTHFGYGKNFPKRALAVPYRLPQMLQALKDGCPIHIFEGEKDADNATAMGMEECVSFGCATDPLPVDYFTRFKDGAVVIWADNDKPGLKRAQEIALALHRNGARVKVVLTPIGKDFSDWKDAGATLDDIAKLLSSTPTWLPTEEQMEALAQTGEFPKSKYDIGSEAFAADYVAHRFRREFRYASNYGQWMRHDKVWRLDKAGAIQERVKSLALTLKKDVERVDIFNRKKLEKLSEKLQTDSGRKAVVSSAKTVESLLLDTDGLDNADTRHLFSCDNGVIDLRRGVLLPHSAEYLITKHSPFPVDLEGIPQKFLAFVHQLFASEEVAEWLLDYLGYCFTGETGFQHFCMWVGAPGTGKSQLQIILRALLSAHCGDIDASSIVAAKQRTAAVESDLCSAHGTRLVFVSELIGQYSLDERVIKCLSGEDVLKVKFMGQDKFPLRARAKLIMTANERPPLSDDGGIARRLIEVRFDKKPTEVVDSLGDKIIAAEGPQILGFLAKRARRYYDNPGVLKPPDEIARWTEECIDEIDFMKHWNEAEAIHSYGAYESSRDIYESIRQYCETACIPFDMNMSMVGRRLARFGYKPERSEGRRGWKHITLRNNR